MSDNESDEDLKRAIALSLADQSPSSSSQKVVVDLVSSDDDDDDDLDAPVIARKITSTKAISIKKDGQPSGASTSNTEKPTKATRDQKSKVPTEIKPPSREDVWPSPNPASLTLLGLDRKKMEEERLLRAQQRTKADPQISWPMPDGRKRKASTPLPYPPEQAAARQVRTKVSDSKVGPEDRPLSTAPGNSLPTLSFKEHERLLGVQYPNGVVKRTWVYGCPRQDDIKIEEVLQKDDLELAVLSAFQIDPDWVASKLNPATKLVFVLQAKTTMEKENFRSGAPSNYRFCFPSMEGNVNCMHSKLQLLSYPTHLRVVVPSANLVPYDWGETGSMENICFLIDLPRLPDGQHAEGELTQFAKELFHFVQAMGLDGKLISSLKKFDFSRTSHLAFVHSIGGSHSGNDMKRTGYCGLGSAVRNLDLHTEKTLDVDIVSASIGNLSDSFINSIYLATQGDDGTKEYGWRMCRAARSKTVTPAEHKLSELLKECFRIYFPTRETVANSKGGLGGAGTICFQSKWYSLDTFPKHLMRDCQSRRRGLLMHNKMIFVRPRDDGPSGSKAWAYVGSANLSESAWGRLVKDKITKEPKLNCRNWECGVIISGLSATSERLDMSGIGQHDLAGMGVFEGHVPVPMAVPGEPYGTRRPWFYNEA